MVAGRPGGDNDRTDLPETPPMPAEPLPTDAVAEETDAPRPPAPDREISLEEWIAAGQACCGAGPDE